MNCGPRLDGLEGDAPIPFRYQNCGDYEDGLVLEDRHLPGETGLDIHIHRS